MAVRREPACLWIRSDVRGHQAKADKLDSERCLADHPHYIRSATLTVFAFMSVKSQNPAILPSMHHRGRGAPAAVAHVWITCMQEPAGSPRIHLALTAALSRKEYLPTRNDPGRTVLEILLTSSPFAPFFNPVPAQKMTKGTLFGSQNRRSTSSPRTLGAPLTPEQSDLASVPMVSGTNGPRPKLAKHVLNHASYNFTGLVGNEVIKVRAIETLRKYGFGSCGPPGFYGTIDVHANLERDIADFLGTEASILYSQGFSTIPCVISAFAKRGDNFVADRGINFAVQKGLQMSRFTGILEKDGAVVDLPNLLELEDKYKYRLIPDESISFGTATQIDMIIGSVANGLNSTSTAYPSSFLPRSLRSSRSPLRRGINIPRNTPSILSTLQENVRAIRAVLDWVEAITIPSHAASPIIHIHLRSAATLSASTSVRGAPTQDIVDEALAQGVSITRARRLRGQELVEARPSIRFAVTRPALSRKECERAASVIKAAVVKVVTKRK
ncbi:pyridoxal phosphate-dependent transferase [Lactarius sanguifluus]|nr:pyridoxal phosphate-dependent transferase [Lactarius sanguifluus]